MTPLNRFILENLTCNSFVNEAIAESGLDVDAMTCRFFKRAEDAVKKNHAHLLPASVVEFVENKVSNAILGKLEMILATGRNIRANPCDIFRLAIAQVQANPDSDDAPVWLALAAESARQVGSNECPF